MLDRSLIVNMWASRARWLGCEIHIISMHINFITMLYQHYMWNTYHHHTNIDINIVTNWPYMSDNIDKCSINCFLLCLRAVWSPFYQYDRAIIVTFLSLCSHNCPFLFQFANNHLFFNIHSLGYCPYYCKRAIHIDSLQKCLLCLARIGWTRRTIVNSEYKSSLWY